MFMMATNSNYFQIFWVCLLLCFHGIVLELINAYISFIVVSIRTLAYVAKLMILKLMGAIARGRCVL